MFPFSISVEAGKSVVTWQYTFEGDQCGHHAEFGSNILADTDSPFNPPDYDFNSEVYVM